MKFTDLFIRKPVLAMVVSLLLVVLGVRSLAGLPVKRIPAHSERRGDDLHDLLRRRRADRRRLHHPAARGGDRPGPGHRLHLVVEQQRCLDDHRQPAPQLRLEPGADRDQHPGQLGQEPAAGAGPGAGAHGLDRLDHRRDVPRLLQRHAADQRRHRLPRPRRQAQARFGRRRADRRAARRAPVRAARLARRRQARRARADRGRRQPGADAQQLPGRRRREQGPDGDRAAHGRHRPALGRGVQEAGRCARAATPSSASRTWRR